MKRVLLTGMSATGKSRSGSTRGSTRSSLLSAPVETMLDRLATRTTNPCGTSAEERQRVLDDTAAVEPLLRGVADHEVVTTAPLDEVVTTVLRLVGA